MLMGQLVDQLLNGISPLTILTEGVDYLILPGDTYVLMSYSGSLYKVENANLFNFPIYANAYHSIMLVLRMQIEWSVVIIMEILVIQQMPVLGNMLSNNSDNK